MPLLHKILSRIFTELTLEPTIKPTYRTVLEISVQELPDAHGPDHLLAITSLEILGMCDYLRIARHQYDEAFRVVEVNATGGRIGFGDGSKWVERLGGEEKYVQPILRKFRELQRRIATDLGPPAGLCLGWPDRSRNVSPYFLGHPDRIGPKGVVTMLVEIA